MMDAYAWGPTYLIDYATEAARWLLSWALALPIPALQSFAALAALPCLGFLWLSQGALSSFCRRQRDAIAPLTLAMVRARRQSATLICAWTAALHALAWGAWALAPASWQSSDWSRPAWLALGWIGLVATGLCANCASEARDHDKPWSDGFGAREPELAALRVARECDDEAEAIAGQCPAGEAGRKVRL